jgi:hypothetical protein
MSTDPRNWASEFGTYKDFQAWQAAGARGHVEIELGELQDLFGWLTEAGLHIEEELLKHAFEFLRRVQVRTPVRTGRARNSWHLIKPESEDLYQYTDNHGTSFDGTLSDGHTDPLEAVVGSNVPYMIALEAGHSRQAPNGMVAITLAELSGALEARLEAIFRENPEGFSGRGVRPEIAPE